MDLLNCNKIFSEEQMNEQQKVGKKIDTEIFKYSENEILIKREKRKKQNKKKQTKQPKTKTNKQLSPLLTSNP